MPNIGEVAHKPYKNLRFFIFGLFAAALSAQIKPQLAILPFTGAVVEDAEIIAEFFPLRTKLTRYLPRFPGPGPLKT
jgi:hypothetical protein